MAHESKLSEKDNDLDILVNCIENWDYNGCKCAFAKIRIVEDVIKKQKRYRLGKQAVNWVEKLRSKNEN